MYPISRKNEITKIRAEINEVKTIKIGKINVTKGFKKKKIKLTKPLARLRK